MIHNKRILALLLARGGSKGVPRKNVRLLGASPLLEWSIRAAQKSRYVDHIVVSTDDTEIAAVARRAGADVPFLRPEALASDTASSIDAMVHAIEQVHHSHPAFDLVVLLQPTSPFRTAEDVDAALELLFEKQAQAVVSVCETDHSPYLSNILPENGCMADFLKDEVKHKNRQEWPTFYRINGAVYVSYIDTFLTHHGFFSNETYAYCMPISRSLDIDSEWDFFVAQAIVQKGLPA